MRKSIALSALLLVSTANAALINGGFESGDFTGWTQVTANTAGGCQIDWTISMSDTICNLPNATINSPSEGAYAAYNSFDGPGPINYIIEQSVTLGNVGSATLSWEDSVAWNFAIGAPVTQSRVFDIDLLAADDSLIGNIYSFAIGANDAISGFQDWTTRSFDVTSLLSAYSGQTIKVRSSVFIPEAFTGPATLGVDNFELTVIPEPTSLALFGVGLLGVAAWRRKKV